LQFTYKISNPYVFNYFLLYKIEVHIKPWPVFGMYQPDSIHTMEVAGESYMLMANEGDSKDYSKFGGFNEEERVGDIDLSGTLW